MDNNKHIKELANNIEVQPPKASWKRIAKKLEASKTKDKTQKLVFQNFFIAASIVLLFACIYFVYTESNNKLLMDKGHIVHWEDLSQNSGDYYNVKTVRQLQAAYLK